MHDPARIDTLIALALSRKYDAAALPAREEEIPTPDADNETHSGGESFAEDDDGLLKRLPGLGAAERRLVERRWKKLAKSSAGERGQWVRRTLERACAARPERNRRFDKSIHPTHIVEALGGERERAQLIILHALPASQAEPAAAALGLAATKRGRNKPAKTAARGAGDADACAAPSATEPALKLAGVVRRAFFAQFVTADALVHPTALDLLSGVELVRLIRLLGVRETAVACRGISAVEAVTAFLRRFPAEEARAIAAHISALTEIEPRRVAFAGRVAREAIGPDFDGAAMLDRIGVSLLAVALATRDLLRRRYAAQKLPVAVSRELLDLVARSDEYCERELASRIVEETEALAANLRRPPAEATERRAGPPYERPSGPAAEAEITESP